jgi:hypothetical protein
LIRTFPYSLRTNPQECVVLRLHLANIACTFRSKGSRELAIMRGSDERIIRRLTRSSRMSRIENIDVPQWKALDEPAASGNLVIAAALAVVIALIAAQLLFAGNNGGALDAAVTPAFAFVGP